jgi:uncharacterized membrane protein YgcG
MKYTIVLVGLVVSFLGTGCMTGYYAHRERRQMVERDSLQPPPMTVDDVIALAQDSVGDDVIINQMNATHSYFRLTSNDIRDLKKNGVSEPVINAMIKSGEKARPKSERVSSNSAYYYPYPDYFWSPYGSDWWWYPWYPSTYLGFGYHGGYYGGHRFIGGYHAGGEFHGGGGFHGGGRAPRGRR